MDQRRFNNPRSDYLPAREAAALLGVKLETLYAYASRGLVRSVANEKGRARRYLRDDLDALRARHDARAGHGPVAATALRWGEPVLESALTEITPAGARYRGRLAPELVARAVPFESAAELLWTGALPPAPPRWSATTLGVPSARLASLLPEGAPPLSALSLFVPALAARDPGRFDPRPDAVLPRARALIARMACALALPLAHERVAPALAAPSVAHALAHALGARAHRDAVRALDTALVLCADHELNASTFAARVAASAGADPYACVSSALAALSGPQHGGVCDRVEALLAEVSSPARAAAVVRDRARRGDAIPGFGHRLYPGGDPRAVPLLDAARALAPHDAAVRTALALVEAMRDTRGEHPTLDLGLVALAAALGLPAGSAVGVFAVGRAAGWIAHVLEQYAAGFLLRPRARYVGA